MLDAIQGSGVKIMNITSFSRIRTKDHTLDFQLVVIASSAITLGDVRGFAARIGIGQTRPQLRSRFDGERIAVAIRVAFVDRRSQRIDIQRTDA